MRASHMTARIAVILGAVLAPVVPAVVAPSLAAAAYATDPGQWAPGDLIEFPSLETGRVDANGRTVTMDAQTGGSPTHRWNNAVPVEIAAERGARKIG